MTTHSIDSFLGLADALQERPDDAAVVADFCHCLRRPSIDGDLQGHSSKAGVSENNVADLMSEDKGPLVLGELQRGGNDDLPMKDVHVREADRGPDLHGRTNRKRCCKANRGEHIEYYHGVAHAA